jgi:DNA-binding CsgD family transcriptional regulator
MIDGGLNRLLLELYACPIDCARWPRMLDRMREALRVRCAAIQVLTTAHERVNVKWAVRDSESQADQAHHDPFISGDQNPRLQYGPSTLQAPTTFIRDRDYFAEGHRGLGQLHERLADLGLGSCLCASAALPGGDRLALVLHRDLKDRRDYSPEDEALITAVMPHLRQAIALCGQLESERHHNRGLRQAVDRMAFGLVLCDAHGRPSWANKTAELAFSTRDGLWLRQNRLTTASPSDTETLRRLIAQAAQRQADHAGSTEQCLALSRSAAGSALHVIVVPLCHEADHDLLGGPSRLTGAEVLLLFSRTSTAPILPAHLVAALFALSPAESRLTIALCQGHTVNDYAAAHGVSIGTARFQLKQVLAKTQAPRQSDLIRRVCTSVVAHAMRAQT